MKKYSRNYFEKIFTRNIPERLEIAKYKFWLLNKQKRNIKNILDIGCGYGDFLSVCSSNKINTYGIDISKEAIGFTKESVPQAKLFKLDAAKKKLPFKNNYFDAVSCFDVVEHLEDTNLLFSEVYRILNNKGVFFLITPPITAFAKILKLLINDDPTHINRQEVSYWEERLKEKNFFITDKKYAFLFGFPPTVYSRDLFRKIKLPVLTKPFFSPIRQMCATLFIFAQKR